MAEQKEREQARRNHERAARASDNDARPALRQAAPIRSQLYRTARKLLVAEVAAARGIEPDAADAWIGLPTKHDPLTARRVRRAPDAEQRGSRKEGRTWAD
jgi:hypothetical protein